MPRSVKVKALIAGQEGNCYATQPAGKLIVRSKVAGSYSRVLVFQFWLRFDEDNPRNKLQLNYN